MLRQDRPNRKLSFPPESIFDDEDADWLEDDFADLDLGNDAGDEARMTLEIISESIKMLFRFAVVVRKFGRQDPFLKVLQHPRSNPFGNTHDIDYVRQTYPKIRDQAPECIVNRLGSAISKRRQFIHFRRRHDTKLGKDDHQDTRSEAGSDVAPSETVFSKATTFDHRRALAHMSSQTVFEDMSFERDEYDALSSEASGDLGGFQLPQLCQLESDGDLTKCPICLTFRTFTDEKEWKQVIKMVEFSKMPSLTVS